MRRTRIKIAARVLGASTRMLPSADPCGNVSDPNTSRMKAGVADCIERCVNSVFPGLSQGDTVIAASLLDTKLRQDYFLGHCCTQ